MKHPDKILSMINFVKWIEHQFILTSGIKMGYLDALQIIVTYADLLNRPLSLEMFVAVKDGKVLSKVKKIDYSLIPDPSYTASEKKKEYNEYEQACKRILFKGWKIEKSSPNWAGKTIENLIQQIDLIGTDNFWNPIFNHPHPK